MDIEKYKLKLNKNELTDREDATQVITTGQEAQDNSVDNTVNLSKPASVEELMAELAAAEKKREAILKAEAAKASDATTDLEAESNETKTGYKKLQRKSEEDAQEDTEVKDIDSYLHYQSPKDDYVVFENVRKVYHVGEVDIEALHDATFSVSKGELAVVVGESGAGKTTLLNILGGMDTLTSGRVLLDGKEISALSQKQLTDYRRFDIGFVFQFYNLMQNLTALENVSLATQICENPLDPAETLRAVGLGDRMYNFPGQLSGGEQQRVAIARALAKNPKLLLCDEPTGALDYNTGKAILQLLQDQARNSGTTVIIITHNKAITPMADRVISVRSGSVQDVRVNPVPTPISEIEW